MTETLRMAVLNLAGVVAILLAASFVPPDSSRADVAARGVLRACVPAGGVSEADRARLEAIAAAIPARLSVQALGAIGADVNPRNWRLTRAQCDMVAGGLADTSISRAFMTIVPTGEDSGWAIWPRPLPDCGGVAVLPGGGGLDRVALTRGLRAAGVVVTPVQTADALFEAYRARRVNCVVAFSGTLAQIAPENPAPQFLEMPGVSVTTLGFGFWKGDATLARIARRVLLTG